MKKERGFTLLEIAIVVGIIGILVVALVPNITSSFETNEMKAAKIKAEAIAKNIKVGIIAGDIVVKPNFSGLHEEHYEDNAIGRRRNRVCYIGGIETLYKIDTTGTSADLIDPTSEADTEEERTFRIFYSSDSNAICISRADDNTILHREPITI